MAYNSEWVYEKDMDWELDLRDTDSHRLAKAKEHFYTIPYIGENLL